jgi:hypothetical protein
MALSRQELRQLAITGAKARIKELDAQRIALLREFPELDSTRKGRTGGRKRRRMSAAQRRAISQRMKRFWAERRKKNGRKAA